MLWILAALVAVVIVYVLARPYLIQIPAWGAFCSWLDPIVVTLFTKSRQIALARLAGLSGVALTVMSTLGDVPVDWQMVGDLIVQRFPETAQPYIQKLLLPAAIWAYGEIMRRATTQPLAEKA